MKVRLEFDMLLDRFEATGNFDKNMRYFIYIPDKGKAWCVSKVSDLCDEDCSENLVGHYDSFSSALFNAINDDLE